MDPEKLEVDPKHQRPLHEEKLKRFLAEWNQEPPEPKETRYDQTTPPPKPVPPIKK